MTFSRKKLLIFASIAVCMVVLPVLAVQAGQKIRHALQLKFYDMHAMLTDQDSEFFDDMARKMGENVMARRDSETTPIESIGAISWEKLAQTKMEFSASDNAMPNVNYNPYIAQLKGKMITAKGFMYPLDQAEKQSHFLLSPYPPSCPFCLPAPPTQLIEVVPDEPMEFSFDPVTVQGHFMLLAGTKDMQEGMLYRITDASFTN